MRRNERDEEERLRLMADEVFQASLAGVEFNGVDPGGAAGELDESWQQLMGLLAMDHAHAEEQAREKGKGVKVRMPKTARAQTASARQRSAAERGGMPAQADETAGGSASGHAAGRAPGSARTRPTSELVTMCHALDAHTELRLCPMPVEDGASSPRASPRASPRGGSKPPPCVFGRPAAAQAHLDAIAGRGSSSSAAAAAAAAAAASSPRASLRSHTAGPISGRPRRPTTAHGGMSGGRARDGGGGPGAVSVVQPQLGTARTGPVVEDKTDLKWKLDAQQHQSSGLLTQQEQPIAMRISSFQQARPAMVGSAASRRAATPVVTSSVASAATLAGYDAHVDGFLTEEDVPMMSVRAGAPMRTLMPAERAWGERAAVYATALPPNPLMQPPPPQREILPGPPPGPRVYVGPATTLRPIAPPLPPGPPPATKRRNKWSL